MTNPYPKSNMPQAHNPTVVPSQPVNPNSGRTFFDTSRAMQAARDRGPIIAPDSRHVKYPSMRDLEKLTIPRPASDIRLGRFDEVLARDLGRHISSRVKEGFRVSPSEAVGVLHHYVGSVRGLQLFDASSQADFEKLAARFAGDPSEKSFQAVEQYLNSLTPEAR